MRLWCFVDGSSRNARRPTLVQQAEPVVCVQVGPDG
jgi:hypothetical protein